jgi:hypothetical protein
MYIALLDCIYDGGWTSRLTSESELRAHENEAAPSSPTLELILPQDTASRARARMMARFRKESLGTRRAHELSFCFENLR